MYLKCEDGNKHDKYAVAVMTGGRTGGHVPKSLSKSFRNSGPVQFFWTGKSCGLGGEMCKKSY